MQHSADMARTSDVTVTDDPAELRYEARRGDTMLGQIRYRTEPGLVVLVHTDVATSAEGSDVGSASLPVRSTTSARAGYASYLSARLSPPTSAATPSTLISSPRIRRPRTEGPGI